MNETQPAAKASRGNYIGAAIAVTVVGAFIIFWLSGAASTGSVLGKIGHTGHTELLSSGRVVVQAGKIQYTQFSVPADAYDAKITGRFIARGGGDGVIVMVMSDTDYLNWRNGRSHDAYFDSGKVTTGNIEVGLPSDQSMYLVFDNSFSSFSDEIINADIELDYET